MISTALVGGPNVLKGQIIDKEKYFNDFEKNMTHVAWKLNKNIEHYSFRTTETDLQMQTLFGK